jgi:hypothetical protein
VRFHVNAEGLSDQAVLKVEVLGHDLKPLPSFSGANAARVTQSGFQTAIAWGGKTSLDGLPDRVRLRVTYEGPRKKDIRVSALYVRDGHVR